MIRGDGKLIGRLIALTLGATLAPVVGSAQVGTIPVASNLSYPLYVTAPAGDAARLFIVGRLGTIRILQNGTVGATPFLDISAKVLSAGAEQGLLGLAFHPNYDTNGYFFVHYTAGTLNGVSRIERYTVSGDPDVADPGSAFSILETTQTAPGHNGGHAEFGSDEKLYLSLGDSTWGFNAQDPDTLLGKVLRIDVDGDDFPGDPTQNYAIPGDNPWVGDPTVRDEIWTFGVRNPYRFSFDPATDDLYLGDVGRDTVEEINVLPGGAPGLNLGWPIMEGSICTDSSMTCNSSGDYELPVYEWPHTGGCHSATGGSVYRGSAIPLLDGHYFFADFCALPTEIWGFDYANGSISNFTDWTPLLDPNGNIGFIAAIARDGVGELYIVEYRVSAGQVHKIVPNPTTGNAIFPGGSTDVVQAYPNPFSNSTKIELSTELNGAVDVEVYSAAGQLVRNLTPAIPTRERSFSWDGRDGLGNRVGAGVYFVRVTTPLGEHTTRMVLLR